MHNSYKNYLTLLSIWLNFYVRLSAENCFPSGIKTIHYKNGSLFCACLWVVLLVWMIFLPLNYAAHGRASGELVISTNEEPETYLCTRHSRCLPMWAHLKKVAAASVTNLSIYLEIDILMSASWKDLLLWWTDELLYQAFSAIVLSSFLLMSWSFLCTQQFAFLSFLVLLQNVW